MIGRPYSPTDLDHPLIKWLGKTVTAGNVRGTLTNVTEDGMATIADMATDMVIAVVPTNQIALLTVNGKKVTIPQARRTLGIPKGECFGCYLGDAGSQTHDQCFIGEV